jgi:hypothetical protein
LPVKTCVACRHSGVPPNDLEFAQNDLEFAHFCDTDARIPDRVLHHTLQGVILQSASAATGCHFLQQRRITPLVARVRVNPINRFQDRLSEVAVGDRSLRAMPRPASTWETMSYWRIVLLHICPPHDAEVPPAVVGRNAGGSKSLLATYRNALAYLAAVRRTPSRGLPPNVGRPSIWHRGR